MLLLDLSMKAMMVREDRHDIDPVMVGIMNPAFVKWKLLYSCAIMQ